MECIGKTMEINAPVDQCYKVLADFHRYPEFLKHIQSIDFNKTREVWQWRTKSDSGVQMEWETIVDTMQPNRLISWHTTEESAFQNSGRFALEPVTPNKTRVDLRWWYMPPVGNVAHAFKTIYKNPEKVLQEDLENLKKVVEQELSKVGPTRR